MPTGVPTTNLKEFFIDAGHEVENPEYFALEDYNALRSKYKK